MKEQKKLYLFDFCDTLVNFQTANAFVNYVITKKELERDVVEYLRIILNRLHLMPFLNRWHVRISVNKGMLLHRLKGFSHNELNMYARMFYESEIKPNIINDVLEELLEAKKNGYDVVVVSGGYDIYLKFFVEEFGISKLLSTTLMFRNGIFTGKINGKDCMGVEKKKYIYDWLGTEHLKSKYSHVVGYSDSETDLPLFSLCDDKVVVLPSSDIPNWVSRLSARVIVK